MAKNRYEFLNIKQNENGDRVYTTMINPEIQTENEVFVEIEVGKRLDVLANEYYNDSSLWWVIAAANNLGKGTLFVEAGTRLRIPQDVNQAYAQLRRTNDR